MASTMRGELFHKRSCVVEGEAQRLHARVQVDGEGALLDGDPAAGDASSEVIYELPFVVCLRDRP
jgi:hypothetical protein